ncbi:MAG: dihydropyrimidinase [Bacteroidota bacterium]
MKNTLIKNGKIITSEKEFQGDVLITGSKITEVKNKISEFPVDAEIIDASGFYVFPGGIDAHVHLSLPSPAGPSTDDFCSGSIAALYGGTTSFIDFVTPAKNESLVSALKERLKFSEKSLLDYSFHMSITSWGPETAREMEIIVKEHGITSFKTYMAYKSVTGIEESELFEVMKVAARLNTLVSVHCEMDDEIVRLQKKFICEGKTSPKHHALSRTASCEALSVKNVIAAAKQARCHVYIVHTSAAASLEEIEKAQKSGQQVYSETCPQYLLLDDSVYDLLLPESLKYVISPPIRKKEDQKKLWNGLKNGSVQVVATDHCPFNLSGQKDIGISDFTKIPNGAGGIEHRLSLLFTYGVLQNKISLRQFVQLCCSNPAKIFGLYPQKGDIAKDTDADIVIWNPDSQNFISAKTHHQNCDSNIYEGLTTKGSPEYVFIKGNKILENHKLNISGLKGSFLQRY